MHLVNGKFSEVVEVTDRALMYGQSLFETLAIINKKPRLLEQHLARLELGCQRLFISFDKALVRQEIDQICKKIDADLAILRITISMGQGGRGYQDPESPEATRILSIYDYPQHQASVYQQGITLGLVDFRLAQQPELAGIKHSNRLEQVLIRRQWQSNWQEALVRDAQDNIIEATQSNVFIVKGEQLLTPDLQNCGVAGVMRQRVIELADKFGLNCQIVPLSVHDIEQADEVFLSNSIIGIWPVKEFLEQRYSSFKITYKLLNLINKDVSLPPI